VLKIRSFHLGFSLRKSVWRTSPNWWTYDDDVIFDKLTNSDELIKRVSGTSTACYVCLASSKASDNAYNQNSPLPVFVYLWYVRQNNSRVLHHGKKYYEYFYIRKKVNWFCNYLLNRQQYV